MKLTIEQAAASMRAGDHAGFERLFELLHPKVLHFCIQQGLPRQDAEEVLQEVFVKLWVSRDKIEPKRNVSAYVYQMAKHVIYDEFKRRVKETAAAAYKVRFMEQTPSVEDDLQCTEIRNAIREVLTSLPEKRRLVFELSRFSGKSNKEIARVMGISIKTVESHITLALGQFAKALQRKEIMLLLAFVF
ncbi:MAG: RNA polymerase sigma-70 factor [Bacteroidota bacterium]